MKKLILLLLATMPMIAQSVSYLPSVENFPNPERGLYHHTETFASSYSQLNQNSLTALRSQGVSLILRVFYLDSFLNSPISQTYLNKMQTDFDRCRNAGVKVVVRFAYSPNEIAGQNNPNLSGILGHISQLSNVITANRDVIACFQAGFIGTWGEWYYSDYFGISNLTPQNLADRQQIFQAVVDNFVGNTSMFVQVRTPAIKTNMYGSTALTDATAYLNNYPSRTGQHNDCFLLDNSDSGTYQNNAEKAWLQQEAPYIVVGGETCGVSTYTECSNFVDSLNKYSWDFLNEDYHPTVISNLQAQGCLDQIKLKLGYRFELLSTTAQAAGISISLRNVGYGHLYNQRQVYIVYENSATGETFPVPVTTDARRWLKNSTINLFQSVPQLPDADYDLYLYMPDLTLTSPDFAVRFANEDVWRSVTGYNSLGLKITVRALGIAAAEPIATAKIDSDTVLISVDFKKYCLFNILGQNVKEGSERRIDISGLPEGIYLLKIDDNKTIKLIKS